MKKIIMVVVLCFVVFHCFAEVNVEAYQKTFSHDELFALAAKLPDEGRTNTLRFLLIIVNTQAEKKGQSLRYMCTVPMFSIGFMDFIFNPDILTLFGYTGWTAHYMSTYAEILNLITDERVYKLIED